MILFLFCWLIYSIIGQGTFGLYRRAKKSVDGYDHSLCLLLWPVFLIIIAVLDSTLEW